MNPVKRKKIAKRKMYFERIQANLEKLKPPIESLPVVEEVVQEDVFSSVEKEVIDSVVVENGISLIEEEIKIESPKKKKKNS